MQKRKPGQPHKGWKSAARKKHKMPAGRDILASAVRSVLKDSVAISSQQRGADEKR